MSVSWFIRSLKNLKFGYFNKLSRYIHQNWCRSSSRPISQIGLYGFQFIVSESVGWFIFSLRNNKLNISLKFKIYFFKLVDIFHGLISLSCLLIVGITGLEMLIRTFFIWLRCRPLVLFYFDLVEQNLEGKCFWSIFLLWNDTFKCNAKIYSLSPFFCL